MENELNYDLFGIVIDRSVNLTWLLLLRQKCLHRTMSKILILEMSKKHSKITIILQLLNQFES